MPERTSMPAVPRPTHAGGSLMRPSLSGPGRLLTAAVAGLLLLTACSSGGHGTGKSVGGKPVQGGTLTAAVDTEPVSWDIHASTQDITAEIQRRVFDSLVSQGSAGKFHPWLATTWEVSDDYRSYTFHLRKDVTFSDGTRYDASAVKANFDHIVAKSTKSLYAISLLDPYTGTRVVDTYTAKVTFSKPFAPFLKAAATTYLGFYSPKALKADAGQLAAGGAADVGSGPFVPGSRILGIGAHRPARVVPNAEVAVAIGSSDEWIRRRSGIVTRHFAAPDESVVEMATVASLKALAQAGVAPGAVDTVLLASMSQLDQSPPAAPRVAHRIGARAAGALDVGAACAGFVHALATADSLIRSGNSRHVVVAGSERMSDIVDPTDRGTAFLFGDGAGAVVVGPAAEPGMGPVVWGSAGDRHEAIAHSRPWPAPGAPVAVAPTLRMDGPAVFRWACGCHPMWWWPVTSSVRPTRRRRRFRWPWRNCSPGERSHGAVSH